MRSSWSASRSSIAFAGGIEEQDQPGDHGREGAPASLVSKVTGVKDSVITQVGQGSMISLPTKLAGAPLVDEGRQAARRVPRARSTAPTARPSGGRWCKALSRFGKFTNLRITTSATVNGQGVPEVFPSTATFSFHNSTYTSPYIQWEPVEQEDQLRDPATGQSSAPEPDGRAEGTRREVRLAAVRRPGAAPGRSRSSTSRTST